MRKTLTLILMLAIGATAAQAQLLISEVLYQPASGEAEYVELYNPTSLSVNLSDFHIVRWIGDSLGRHYPLPDHEVAPHSYVVVTKDATSVSTCFRVPYPSQLIECALPTFPNDGGAVVLSTADSLVVDRLDYSPSMHSPLLRNRAGVSLERRRFDSPTADPQNWFSAASTAGYGTPTAPNSQSHEFLAEETAFDFSSTLLSPDGDGYQDVVEITYRLQRDDLMGQIAVYARDGRLVKRLANNALLGTHGSLVWDGLSEDGQVAPRGKYLVEIVLYNTDGREQRIKRSVSVVFR